MTTSAQKRYHHIGRGAHIKNNTGGRKEYTHMYDTCDGQDKSSTNNNNKGVKMNYEVTEAQVKASAKIVALVREFVNDEEDTLLEQMDAILYAAEKLKEINKFINDEHINEVMDFFKEDE